MSKRQGPCRVHSPLLVKSFARRLRLVMADSGVRGKAMAATLGGIPQETITRWKRGQIASITFDALHRLAHWADEGGYSVLWLFTGEGPMRKDGSE